MAGLYSEMAALGAPSDNGCTSWNAYEKALCEEESNSVENLLFVYMKLDRHVAHFCGANRYGDPKALGDRPVSEDKAKRLRLSMRRNPRYLIRVFTGLSGHEQQTAASPSLDLTPSFRSPYPAPLNTTRNVQSHAHVAGTMHNSIFDIAESSLFEMIDGHLGESVVCSEFTSWASSLQVCLRLGCSAPGFTRYIAVMDTHKQARRPEVFHVPQLWRAGLASDTYEEEYLIHGKVGGSGYSYLAVPQTQLQVGGLSMNNFVKATKTDEASEIEQRTLQAMHIAAPFWTLACTYNDHGIYIYMVAIMLGERYQEMGVEWWERQLPSISHTIQHGTPGGSGKIAIPKAEWRADDAIMAELVFVSGAAEFREVAFAIRLLRYLALH